MSHKKRGIALIASVMLIVFVSIAVLSVTIFIVQRLSELDAKRIYTNSIYLAQAGVHQALYDFRFHDIGAGTGYFTLGTTPIDANNSFTLTATAADRLMVNTAAANLNNNKDVTGLTIQNASNSLPSITITSMIVSWSNNRKLTKISINGSNVWTGNAAGPSVNAVFTNACQCFTLNTTPSIYLINFIRFSGNMSADTISVQFVMTDGSTTQNMQVFPIPVPATNNFTVRSKGSMTGSPIFRTIQADYNAITAKIFNYKEL